MADYIYLLQTRLTLAQQEALNKVREVARSRAMTVFLVGGAVRDLTSGSPIRDLDLVVQGNALKLRKEMQSAGAVIIGESDIFQSLHLTFPGGIRVEVGSTLSISYPKPGKPLAKAATILEDLRRRDFTSNAMAISLNEGSFGLLMDPLNGVADIENRELRLVSNYGFIEDPVRMIRATRLGARLGWHLEEKTQQRYDTGKAEGYISALSASQRGYETEEIFHEEDPLRVLRRLESEGWVKFLVPGLSSSKANEIELDKVRDIAGRLQGMGIHPDPSAAYFPLLTAKMAPKEVATLKGSFARPGYVDQIAALERDTKAFGAAFMGKAAATPSEAWKMLMSAPPEQVLWLAHTSKSAPIQARFKAFLTEWPSARQRIPYQLMQEMRIHPDLPGYDELLEKLFFAIMDGKLDTPEATKAFLEPYSPPAPPPPVNMRRRPVKRDVKPAKSRSKKAVAPEADSAAEAAVVLPAGSGDAATGDPSERASGKRKAPEADAQKGPAAKESSPAKKSEIKSPAVRPVIAKASLPDPSKAQTRAKVPAKTVPARVSAKAPAKGAAKASAKGASKASPKAAAKQAAKKQPAKPQSKVTKSATKKMAPTKSQPAKSKAAKRTPAKGAAAKGASSKALAAKGSTAKGKARR